MVWDNTPASGGEHLRRAMTQLPWVLSLCLAALSSAAQEQPTKVIVDWGKVVSVSRTTPTLQVVVNPPLRRGTAVHDNAFQALHELGADYVRYVPWLPYPRLGVAELEPPQNGKTSWDFSLIDPMTIDFLNATRGHPVILNFSTIPQWMYKTDAPVPYPADPNQVTWEYEKGSELRDPSGKEVADYYARLLSWYTRGGFSDELGKRHESGYHYSIPYWEVLNEVDFEHHMSPETYTRIYDAVVEAMKQVQPDTRFVGMALAAPGKAPEFFEYFLNHKNHQPDVPLDFISYHFYATPAPGESPDAQQYSFFAQADGFVDVVRYIESIRRRLSPQTRTTVDEIGAISADDSAQGEPGHVTQPIPNSYWNLAGAMYAYVFGELSTLGVDVAGESQLVGYPTQFPSVSMVDWENGKPNARFWVLRLLHDSFAPGDKLVEVKVGDDSGNPFILAAITPQGGRRVLLVNKRDRSLEIFLPGAAGGREEFVDQMTAFQPPASMRLVSDKLILSGFAVAVVTLP
jgi:hypothetical protein